MERRAVMNMHSNPEQIRDILRVSSEHTSKLLEMIRSLNQVVSLADCDKQYVNSRIQEVKRDICVLQRRLYLLQEKQLLDRNSEEWYSRMDSVLELLEDTSIKFYQISDFVVHIGEACFNRDEDDFSTN